MSIRKTLTAVSLLALAATSGCALLPAQNQAAATQVVTLLDQIANTAAADLNSAIAAANAATPPDADGARCASGVLTVQAAVAKLLAATPTASTVGVFTTAEIASLYQPGSAQFTYAVTTLETACIAKVHDVNAAATSQAAIMAGIAGAVQLAPVVAAVAG